MIEAKKISKNFGNLNVLKEIDLKIEPAEIVSITGASGAGKSTLLHILGSLESPDSGEVNFDNTNIASLSSSQLAKFRNQKMGFVFQFHHLLPEFTALENVMLPALIAADTKAIAKEKAIARLDSVGLAERAGHKPSEMSGGEQQRVSVARGLVNNPKVIFADEPTGNLDSANALSLHQLFETVNKEFGTSFVIVTHNLELAKTANRCLQIKDGKIQ